MQIVLRTAFVAFMLAVSPAPGQAAEFEGRVRDAGGAGVLGAKVTFSHGDPVHTITVFSGEGGRFHTPEIAGDGPWQVRVRRIGWADLEQSVAASSRELALEIARHGDPVAVAGQLPSNIWYGRLLASIEDESQREEFVRQCTYCHQQGSWATRILRPEEQWQKILALMARMGAGLSPELRSRVPELMTAAYDPVTAVPALTARMNEPDFAPPPEPLVRQALIEEWQVGHQASMQHDIVVHPDGRVYSVDMTQDKLYRLDPSVPGGEVASFDLPETDLPLGG
ncbi:MAG: carboxypeptidase regulatory-like domain-containing protein, partial [bacterium]|nr:carboxypeptidase regulatory-like domain-containing protein [bacterium]